MNLGDAGGEGNVIFACSNLVTLTRIFHIINILKHSIKLFNFP
jgi:hypothetical protein